MNRGELAWEEAISFLRDERALPEDFLRHVCISQEDASDLHEVVAADRPKAMLEVGSFVGLSTAVIAATMDSAARLVCVDPNLPVGAQLVLGSGRIRVDDERPCLEHTNAVLRYMNRREDASLIEGYFSRPPAASVRSRLGNVGVPPWVGSRLGAKGEKFEFIFLDGDHSEAAVFADLVVASGLLASGGVVVLHDVVGDWGESVWNGVIRFLACGTGFEFECKGGMGYVRWVRERGDLV